MIYGQVRALIRTVSMHKARVSRQVDPVRESVARWIRFMHVPLFGKNETCDLGSQSPLALTCLRLFFHDG